MMKTETIDSIIENLRLLTINGQIEWKNDNGIFYMDYLDDQYDISPLAFLINNTVVDVVIVNKTLQDFYSFLNDIVVGETTLGKLNKALSDSFLNDFKN